MLVNVEFYKKGNKFNKNALLIYYSPSSYNYIKTFKYYNHIRILSFLNLLTILPMIDNILLVDINVCRLQK